MHEKEYHRLNNGRVLQILAVILIGMLLLAACGEAAPAGDQAVVDLADNGAGAVGTISVTPPSEDGEAATTTATTAPTSTSTTAPSPTVLPTATPIVYVVQAADTLWGIAERFGVSPEAIQRANNLTDGNLIQVGQELLIPSGESSAAEDLPLTATATSEANSEDTPEPTATETTTAAPASADADTPAPSPTAERGVLPNYVLCPQETDPIPAGAQVVGYSAVCQLPILSYRFGDGETPLILVGGMHGGYEWNTILLAYEVFDYLQANPGFIPSNLSIYLIPNGNPDGLYAVTQKSGRFSAADVQNDTVPGRFNGRNVDLNRNWDCNWSPVSTWRDNEISGGSAPFSEPENAALRDYFLSLEPATVLFWHSAANGIYAAGCGAVDAESKELAQLFGSGAGYPVYDSFQHYDITGDASDWLATQEIPSFTVELKTHELLDWDSNLAGLRVLLGHFANEG